VAADLRPDSSRIYYINKETFLLAFKAAFKQTFTAENIRAGF
jgi:hypothetical protein